MKASKIVAVLVASLFLTAAGANAAVEVIDFGQLPAGTIVNEVFGNLGTGPVKVRGQNGRFGPEVNAAIIFDSANPTGGDVDLCAPNETFVINGNPGPGRGVGGMRGSAFENAEPLGKLLIIAENMTDANSDGLIDDPDDEGELRLVRFTLDFSEVGPVTLHRMTLIDVEDRERTPTVQLFDAADVELFGRDLSITDDNGVVRESLGPTAGVVKMVVDLHGSGAISSIRFERPDTEKPPRPSIDIEKLTNDAQADLATDADIPLIEAGQPVTWTYVVTNTGEEQLQNVAVTDDRGVAVECPKDTLEPGETMKCMGSGVALDLGGGDLGFEPIPGVCRSMENQPLYGNVGSVNAVGTVSELIVTDSDPSHYCGSVPEPPKPCIYVRKQKKGPDTRTITAGTQGTFEIFVKNSCTVDLTDVQVTDALSPDCDRSFPGLAAGESERYECKAPALTTDKCRFVNEVVATGMGGGQTVTDRDTSTLELEGGLEIEKTFTGVDQDGAHFEITVTNNGCDLDKVRVTDEVAPGCAKEIGALASGESHTYKCSMSLEFTNEACAEGGKRVKACDSVTFTVTPPPVVGPDPEPEPEPEPGPKPNGDDDGPDGKKKASNWLLLLALVLLIGGGLFAWNRMKAG